MQEIQDAIDDYEDPKWLRVTALVKHLLSKAPSIDPRPRLPRRHNAAPRGAHPPPLKSLLGNPDLQVLKPENQTPTHVTPLIASLAQGLVQEDLVVVGPPPPPQNKAQLEREKNAAHTRLFKLVENAKLAKYVDDKVRLAPKSRFLKSVSIAHEKYSVCTFYVKDFLPTYTSSDVGWRFHCRADRSRWEYPSPSPSWWHWGYIALVDDCRLLLVRVFKLNVRTWLRLLKRFAKIIYIDDSGLAEHPVHVQWLEHGSQILMEELAHPQELFYNDLCGSIPYKVVVGKVTVHEDPKFTVKAEDFFVKWDIFCQSPVITIWPWSWRFTHDKTLSAFISINRERRKLVIDGPPDDNCPICWRVLDQRTEEEWRIVKDEEGNTIGVAYLWQQFHFEDFVLYRSQEKGPAKIGYITGFKFPKNE
jgi:DNA (cytosine-5)-methyltransferase 1